MPVHAYSLFSSSSGNCSFFTDGTTSFLIDAGGSCRRIAGSLAGLGASPSGLSAILITHEHTDHTAALPVLTAKYDVPVHAPAPCVPFLRVCGAVPHPREYELTLGNFTIRSFITSHDSRCSVGYRITHADGTVAAAATDTGFVTEQMKQALAGCRAVLLESNYDADMLIHGSYPAETKRRIASDSGHLSNAQCAELLPYLYGNGTRRVILGHISAENNTNEAALRSADEARRLFRLDGLEIECAERAGTVRII